MTNKEFDHGFKRGPMNKEEFQRWLLLTFIFGVWTGMIAIIILHMVF